MNKFFAYLFFVFTSVFCISGMGQAEEITASVEVKMKIKTTPVVVVLPHQDDELFMAGAIQQFIKTKRKVYVVMVSDGGASSARAMINGKNESNEKIFCDLHRRIHNPIKEGYRQLTKQTFSTARNREFIQSLSILGIPRTRILFLNSKEEKGAKNPIYKDGDLPTTAEQAIAEIFKKYGDGTYVTVAGGHNDHVALEEALKNNVHITEKIFFPLANDGLTQSFDLTKEELLKKGRAVRAYEMWSPKKGMYAIGGHSVPELLHDWRQQDKEFYYSVYK